MESSVKNEPQPRIKILQITRMNFTDAGITPNLSTQAYPLNTRISLGFMILGLHVISELKYIFYEARTFAEYTQTIYMGSLTVFIAFCLVIIISNADELFELIDTAENIVNTTLKYSESKRIFIETIQFGEKLIGILFFVIVRVTPVCGVVLWSTYIYFIYFTTDLGNAAFELPAPMWLPFDWRNPIGFFIAISMQYVAFSYILKIGACVLTLPIGLYLYAIAMIKCVKEILFAVSKSAKAKTERKHIRAELIEFMQFHSRVKHLIRSFSDIYQQFITILFIWSLVTVCAALLLIQLQILHHGDNFAVLLIITIQVLYAFGVMFITCELCQRLNLAYEECSGMVDQFKWYLFSVEIKRMLPTIINFVQQPAGVKCFGTMACGRETFKYVIKTAFQYSTVLRKFYD